MSLKLIVDCHVHSNFSADSQMLAQNGVVSAINSGLAGLAFTDHLDLDYTSLDGKLFTFDFTKRSNFLDELRKSFVDKVKILKGIEVGLQPQVVKESGLVVKNYDFDFVICSIHMVDKCDLGNLKFYEGKTKRQAYQRYLEEIYSAVCNFDDFDVVGHIGYICRYSPYEDRILKFNEHQEILDKILKKVIDKNKGIEVNTSGYYNNLNGPTPNFDIIKRYKELGGKILTISSDAHFANKIGHNFDFVLEELKKMGFDHLNYFEKRKPVFVKI